MDRNVGFWKSLKLIIPGLYFLALVRHVIQDISISRKHLVIEVSSVQPGDGVRSSDSQCTRPIILTQAVACA